MQIGLQKIQTIGNKNSNRTQAVFEGDTPGGLDIRMVIKGSKQQVKEFVQDTVQGGYGTQLKVDLDVVEINTENQIDW